MVSMTQPSPLRALVELRYGAGLAEFVTARRANEMSWRAIAHLITEQTGVQLGGETLRQWFTPVVAEDSAA